MFKRLYFISHGVVNSSHSSSDKTMAPDPKQSIHRLAVAYALSWWEKIAWPSRFHQGMCSFDAQRLSSWHQLLNLTGSKKIKSRCMSLKSKLKGGGEKEMMSRNKKPGNTERRREQSTEKWEVVWSTWLRWFLHLAPRKAGHALIHIP